MSSFSDEDLRSETYRWREDGKGTLVHIFSRGFPLSQPGQRKRIFEDSFGGQHDIDCRYLRNFFNDNKEKFPGGVEVVPVVRLDSHFDAVSCIQFIKDMKKTAEYEKYDCFIFAFLTFSDEQGLLHIEKDKIPLEEILSAVSTLKVARGKPKVFLIQSDEMSLGGEKVYKKGGQPPKLYKIPTDADRLIIQSIIPQCAVPEKFLKIASDQMLKVTPEKDIKLVPGQFLKVVRKQKLELVSEQVINIEPGQTLELSKEQVLTLAPQQVLKLLPGQEVTEGTEKKLKVLPQQNVKVLSDNDDASEHVFNAEQSLNLIMEESTRLESFLIQAFVEVMKENFDSDQRKDLLSLTVEINKKVKDKINFSDSVRKEDLPLPLVTSTLTKRLEFNLENDGRQ